MPNVVSNAKNPENPFTINPQLGRFRLGEIHAHPGLEPDKRFERGSINPADCVILSNCKAVNHPSRPAPGTGRARRWSIR